MHVIASTAGLSRAEAYRSLNTQLAGVLTGERDGLANTANAAALLYQGLPDLNWAGFYFLRDGELVLGAFQGKVACVRVALGRGVCGTAAQRRETVIVRTYMPFPATSRATRRRVRKSWCRSYTRENCAACSTSTVRCPGGSTRRTRQASRRR